MNDGLMHRACYVNLDGTLDRLYYAYLDRPKLCLWSVILDHIKGLRCYVRLLMLTVY